MKDTKVITEFSALKDVVNSVNFDSLTWKNRDGSESKLMEMNVQQLQKAYNHTTDMLFNTNKYTTGRVNVKKNIKVLIRNCNAELLRRYLLHELNIGILKTNVDLIEFIRDHKVANNLKDADSVNTLFMNLPQEFESVTINELIDACFDKLDVINRKMLTDGFIYAQGIWLTEDEKEMLTEYDSNGKMRPWLDVVKERLLLSDVKLRVDPKGFSYAEFRSIVHLEPLPKISKLPSDTLRLLRDKVFLLLDADTDYHIEKWMRIKSGIEEVAKYRGIILTVKEY